jgi:hypothetical protein
MTARIPPRSNNSPSTLKPLNAQPKVTADENEKEITIS